MIPTRNTKKNKKLFDSAKQEVSELEHVPVKVEKSQVSSVKKWTVLERRAKLACLLPRGYSYAELALHLKKAGFCDTGGKPLPEAVIKADITGIETYWKEVCAESVDKHRARQLMELTKLKSAAYEHDDYELVLKVVSKEIDLLGTKIVAKEANNGGGTTIFDFRNQAISFEQRDKLAMDVLNSARKRAGQQDNADKNPVDTSTETA